jgi:hypothetical protein
MSVKHKFAFVAVVASTLLTTTSPALADTATATNALNSCLADNTSGKDRKDLARWVLLAMTAHPEIREVTNPLQGANEAASKQVAQLITRLLTETCVKQVQASSKAGGSNAIVSSFEFLGRLAMQEITSNKDVEASMSGVARLIDSEKLAKVLGTK